MDAKVIELFRLAGQIHNYAITCAETENEELTNKIYDRLNGLNETLDKVVVECLSDSLGIDLQPYMSELTETLEKYATEFKEKIDSND